MSLREWVKRVPVLRDVARLATSGVALMGRGRFDSARYWERRYASGRNSGPGSYNRLAEFKAQTLNQFVQTHGIATVLELGSGDGAQLELAKYPHYTGVDVAPTVIERARRNFADDETKRFVLLSELEDEVAELTLSLDVIYHLVEDEVFHAHMRELFDRSTGHVAIYASNSDKLADSVHVRHRKFSDWIDKNRKDFRLLKMVENPYAFDPADPDNTSFADFYFYQRSGV